jgi:adenylate cyclase
MLFCDIRGFSRITESQKDQPQLVVDWVRSVLTTMSDCVVAENGVVVDFIGDAIFAMWGAPRPQSDHAERACRAALAMLRARTEIDQKWAAALGASTRLGIGINSGKVNVGNIGSDRRMKYGPLGGEVNLASRVQGTSKYLNADLIITGSTKALIGDHFRARRLCQVQVVNIDQPVDLYELPVDPTDSWDDLVARYQEALQRFENQKFREAAKILGQIFQNYADDGPSLALLARSVNCLVDHAADCRAVWQLHGK